MLLNSVDLILLMDMTSGSMYDLVRWKYMKELSHKKMRFVYLCVFAFAVLRPFFP